MHIRIGALRSAGRGGGLIIVPPGRVRRLCRDCSRGHPAEEVVDLRRRSGTSGLQAWIDSRPLRLLDGGALRDRLGGPSPKTLQFVEAEAVLGQHRPCPVGHDRDDAEPQVAPRTATCTASTPAPPPAPRNTRGSVTMTACVAENSALRVSSPRDGGQSTSTRSYRDVTPRSARCRRRTGSIPRGTARCSSARSAAITSTSGPHPEALMASSATFPAVVERRRWSRAPARRG